MTPPLLSLQLWVLGLVWFYGISTILGNLKPNLVYWNILDISMNIPSGAPDPIVSDVLPKSLGVSGLSTSYSFTSVILLVLIIYQVVVRESNCRKIKTTKNLWGFIQSSTSGTSNQMCLRQSLFHKKGRNQENAFPANRESDCPVTHLNAQNRLKGKLTF